MLAQLKLLFLSLVFFFWGSTSLWTQVIKGELNLEDTTQTHIIHTKKGDVFLGKITSILNTTLYFQFKQNELVFKLNDLKRIEVIESESAMTTYLLREHRAHQKNMRLSYPTIHGHENLLISPTAFNLKKGQGEYRTTEILWNMVDFGLTDDFSIGGGILVPFLAHFRAKYTRPIVPKIHGGIGTNLFIMFIDNGADSPLYNHTYTTISFGTQERFLTGSVGYFFPFSDRFTDDSAVFTFGGSFRFGKYWRLMIDSVVLPNFSINDPRFFPSLNFSWFNQENRIDFGLISFWQQQFGFVDLRTIRTNILVIPTINYARRFGR